MAEDATVTTEATTEEISEHQPTPLADIFSQEPPSASPKEEVKAVDTTKEVKTGAEETVEKTTEEQQTETAEEKPAVNWDAEDNPYKRDAENFKKRYEDTQKWGNRAHQKLKEYGLDEEDPEASEAEKLQALVVNEREIASYAAVLEHYGEEQVKKVWSEGAPIFKLMQQNPQIHHRIFNAPAPVLEAFKVMKEEEFFGKYGRDVEKIPDKIRTELEAELREKITKELQRKLTQKEKMPDTLTGVKSKDVKTETKPFTPTPVEHLFG